MIFSGASRIPGICLIFFQWEWKNESVGHILLNQRFQEMVVQRCTLVISKVEGLFDVGKSMFFTDF